MSEHYCLLGNVECGHYKLDVCLAKRIYHITTKLAKIFAGGKCPWPELQIPVEKVLSDFDRGRIAGRVEMKTGCLDLVAQFGDTDAIISAIDAIPTEPA